MSTRVRALLVKMSSLGDVIHALPAVSDAAAHGVVFDWVIEEAFAPVAARHPGVHTVLPISWRRWRRAIRASRSEMQRFFARLREERYDVILDSQGLIKSAVVSRMARGDLRSGYHRDCAREPLAALVYDKHVHVPSAQHAIDRQRQLFAQTFGYDVPGRMSYGLSAGVESGVRTVLLLHGTTWSTKHYPESDWLRLIELALREGHDVAVTYGNAPEKDRAERLRQRGATVWSGMPLGDLIERMAGVSLVIGVDSGLAHLAAALGRPVVGLYGPTDPALTGVRGDRAASIAAAFPCAPCRRPECTHPDKVSHADSAPCFGVMPPEQIWQMARAQMARI